MSHPLPLSKKGGGGHPLFRYKKGEDGSEWPNKRKDGHPRCLSRRRQRTSLEREERREGKNKKVDVHPLPLLKGGEGLCRKKGKKRGND